MSIDVNSHQLRITAETMRERDELVSAARAMAGVAFAQQQSSSHASRRSVVSPVDAICSKLSSDDFDLILAANAHDVNAQKKKIRARPHVTAWAYRSTTAAAIWLPAVTPRATGLILYTAAIPQSTVNVLTS